MKVRKILDTIRMTEVLTPEQRKLCISRIRGKDTKPELIVRQLIHAMGFRYSLHRSDLPDKPDLTFVRLKKVIFVHGCFWHMHSCRYGRVKPATNPTFWESKRLSNKKRDAIKRTALQHQGWDVLIIWECRTRDLNKLSGRIFSFLNDKRKMTNIRGRMGSVTSTNNHVNSTEIDSMPMPPISFTTPEKGRKERVSAAIELYEKYMVELGEGGHDKETEISEELNRTVGIPLAGGKDEKVSGKHTGAGMRVHGIRGRTRKSQDVEGTSEGNEEV